MSSVLYAFLAILILSVLIVLHELGHYLAGRWLGFEILEFSVGMGPIIYKHKGKHSDFTLRAFLIGGACRFNGEDEAASDGKSFNAQKVWKRFIVVLAGPFMNYLTALVLAAILLLSFGTSETIGTDNYLLVTGVEAGSAAETAGVVEGDILTGINGKAFADYDGFKIAFDAVKENETEVTVLRGATLEQIERKEGDTTFIDVVPKGGETTVLQATDIRDIRTGNNRLGVSLSIAYKSASYTEYNVFTAAIGAFPYCGNMIKQVYSALGNLITGKACINEMSGVIGTVSVMSESMEQASAYGIADVMYVILVLGALISVNFAVVNLLPIPALDGGRLVFIILEMLRGKPIDPEKEGIVHFIGMILLLALIAVLMVSDLINCFRG